MLLASTIPNDARHHIENRLADLCGAEGVRILFAVESGSRAWGFPSADSDYDVRFVYARPQADYLSVRDFRDIIETPLVDDPVLGVPFDLNGWDLRKALRLALTSNPVLHEWLVSPVRYGADAAGAAAILAFAADVADPLAFRYHYDRLCRAAWAQCVDPDRVMVKRYCYALRPALMLRWMARNTGLPPMDMASLCAGQDVSAGVVEALADLFRHKAGGGEGDLVPRIDELDRLICDMLEDQATRPEKTDIDAAVMARADALFRACLI